MSKVLCLIITVFAIMFVAYCASAEQIVLPFDEKMADYLIDEGELDSSLWDEIHSYYVEKISVPHGELFILRELFPHLPDDLPVNLDDLQEYVPWNKKKIEQFLSDYPYLQDYRQILDFGYLGAKQLGKIGFTYYESNVSNKSRQSAQIITTPVSWIKFQSRVDFTTEFARWQRRSLQIKPTKWLTLDLGNYTNTFDQGLIFGKFPNADNKTVEDNWLYGKNSSWNGVCVSAQNLNLLSGLSVSAFFHKRYTEMAFGFDSKIRISKPLLFQAGVSNLNVNGLDSNLTYFHCGSQINISQFVSQIVVAFDLFNPTAVSFISKSRINLDKTNHNIEFLFMPREYFAPRSRLMNSGLGSKISSASLQGSFIRTGVESCYKINKNSVSLGVNADIYEMIPRKINCFFKAKVSNLLIGYLWKNIGFAMDSIYHNFNCKYNFVLNEFVNFETEQYIALKYHEQLAYYGELGAEFTFPIHLNVKPFIRLRTNKNTKLENQIGLKQIFTPFERIYTELILENTFGEMKNGHIEIKAWFLF